MEGMVQDRITGLRVNYLENPLGLDSAPRFFWQILSQRRGAQQCACLLYTSIFGPTAEQEDLFLGKIDSGWTYATDDEDDATKVYPAVEDGSYPTAGEYHYAKIQGIIGGYVGLCYDLFEDSQYRSSPASNTRGEQDIITPQITDEYYPCLLYTSRCV